MGESAWGNPSKALPFLLYARPPPSPEDVRVTKQIVDAGKLLDIELMDHNHPGIGLNRFVSLKERGIGILTISTSNVTVLSSF